jgi:excinuclease ABC subunit C
VAYNVRFNENVAANYDALETLRVILNLPALPRRIECFDISTIQGSETVASMVVCEDGRMKRADYRKFRIRGQGPEARGQGVRGQRSEVRGQAIRGQRSEVRGQGGVKGQEFLRITPGAGGESRAEGRGLPSGSEPAKAPDLAGRGQLEPQRAENVPGLRPLDYGRLLDDFAAMHEVVLRRYRRLLEHGGPFPDLVLIDGGKGQLNAAYDALEQLGLANLVAVGLAKKEELLFTREHADPIAIAKDNPALLLVQRIRDEAHRFAVTFHRQARSGRDLRSALDEIAGIGPRRRRALLTHFGSLAGVRRATREDLVRVVGAKTADAVLAYFAGNG